MNTTRRDISTYAGMLAVAVAAAVLSFSALSGLAELAGVSGEVWGFRLAWLLPIAIDAYAMTATRVWLRSTGAERVRQYARSNAVGAIGLSMTGNGAYHYFTSAGVTSLATVSGGWLVVVTVSAVPPVILGLVGHLHALVAGEHADQEAPRERRKLSPPSPAAGVPDECPVLVPASVPVGVAVPVDRDDTKSGTTHRERPGVPAGRDESRGAAEKKMRDYWTAERAEDRTPSGADLDRVAGTRDYGRKVRRALLAEEADASGEPTRRQVTVIRRTEA